MGNIIERRKLSTVGLAILVFIGLASCLLQLQAEGYHLRHSDAIYYAQVARNLVQTGRFSTSVMTQQHFIGTSHPVDLDRPWPVRVSSLGYPLLLAGLFAVLGIGDYVCHIVSIVMFIGLIVVIFRFARDLGGVTAGLAASGLAITHSTLAHEAIVGELETTYAFLGLLSLYLVYRSNSQRAIVAAALLVGLAYVIRPTAVVLLLLGALVLWPKQGTPRWKWLGLFAAALAVIMVLGGALQSRLTPAPFAPREAGSSAIAQNLLYGTEAYPGHEVFRGNQRITMAEVLKYKRDIAEKIVRTLRAEYTLVATWVFIPIVVLGAIGAMNPAADRRYDQLSLCVLALFMAHLLIPALSAPDAFHRYVTSATVMLIPLAGVGLCLSLREVQRRWGRLQFVAICLFIAGWVLYPRAVDVAEQFVIPNVPFEKLVAQEIAAYTQPEDIVLTDEVDRATAWYGQRRVIRLPETVENTMALCRRAQPIAAIAVTAHPRFFQPPDQTPASEWFPGFTLTKSFSISDGSDQHEFYLYKKAKQ